MPAPGSGQKGTVVPVQTVGTRDDVEAELLGLEAKKRTLTSQISKRKAAGEDISKLVEQARRLSEQIGQLRDQDQVQSMETKAALSGGWATRLLTQTSDLESLRDDWHALLAQAETCSPFMQWEWAVAWWKHFGADKQLRLITVRDESGALVGIAPLMLGFFENRRLSRRTLAFIGSGEEGPRGQYFSMILRRGHEAHTLSHIWRAMRDMEAEWDVLRLWRMADDASLWRVVSNAVQHWPNGVFLEPAGKAVWDTLPADFDEFVASLPSTKERKRFGKHYAKLQRVFPDATFRICETTEELHTVVPAILALNIERQADAGRASTWASQRYNECVTNATCGMYEAGRAVVGYLTIGGDIVAGEIALRDAESLYFYSPGFALSFRKHNVMNVVYGGLIEYAIGAGISAADWLSGQDYKRRYLGQEKALVNINLYSSSAHAFERSARNIWLRSVRRRIRSLLSGKHIGQRLGTNG